MSEFANRIRTRAAETLLRLSEQEPPKKADPILELIGFLLADDSGGLVPPADSSVSMDQWLTWNRLALMQPESLSETVTRLLEQERMELPQEPAALRQWAADLLLATLDLLMIA